MLDGRAGVHRRRRGGGCSERGMRCAGDGWRRSRGVGERDRARWLAAPTAARPASDARPARAPHEPLLFHLRAGHRTCTYPDENPGYTLHV